MREIFLDIDKDGSGSITAEEFAQALRKKGNNLPEDDVQRLVAVSFRWGLISWGTELYWNSEPHRYPPASLWDF